MNILRKIGHLKSRTLISLKSCIIEDIPQFKNDWRDTNDVHDNYIENRTKRKKGLPPLGATSQWYSTIIVGAESMRLDGHSSMG